MWKVGNYLNNRFKPRGLICDQEAQVRSVLHEYLISVGFSADQAKEGHELLELACNTHPDVILLDLDMPDMDGQTIMRHLRRMGINVPVILFGTGGSLIPFDD